MSFLDIFKSQPVVDETWSRQPTREVERPDDIHTRQTLRILIEPWVADINLEEISSTASEAFASIQVDDEVFSF